MTHNQRWKQTTAGKVIVYLGSVRFAVPVLTFVAFAMIWGTYIDTTRGAAAAGGAVYGSWWFIGLMALVCLSLVLSVVTRWPWRRKHIGFIVVHASLIALIVSAFISYFHKIEGKMILREGQTSSQILTNDWQITLLDNTAGAWSIVDSAPVDGDPLLTVGAEHLQIVEFWPNSVEQLEVTDAGANPLHAVQLGFSRNQGAADWIGELRPGEKAPIVNDIEVHVLPAGRRWAPSADPDDAPEAPTLTLNQEGAEPMPLPSVGQRIGATPWTVTGIDFYQHAIIDLEGLREGDPERDNPAAAVFLTHDDGSVQRLLSFALYPDSLHSHMIEGATQSPFTLKMTVAAESTHAHTALVIERIDGHPQAKVITPDGSTTAHELHLPGPWPIPIGDVTAIIFNDYAKAIASVTRVRAPEGDSNAPAIVVDWVAAGASRRLVLAMGVPTPIRTRDGDRYLNYEPIPYSLSFAITLEDFRKMEYPGSEMAMAYESDVVLHVEDTQQQVRIWMNNPLIHDGWRLYQSGYVGDSMSILQATRDPGLYPLYASSFALCVGITLTFFIGPLGGGHPGIPAPFTESARKASHDDPQHQMSESPDRGAADGDDSRDRPASLGGDNAGLGAGTGSDPGGASGQNHADRHARPTDRSRADRAHKVAG